MQGQVSFRRDLRVALCLGLSALIINVVLEITTGTMAFQLGNVLLYMCAAALGPIPTLTALAIAVVPSPWIVNGLSLGDLRTVVLCGSTALILKTWPRTPVFLPTLAFWLVVFGPLLVFLQTHPQGVDSFTTDLLIITAISDIVFAAAAGALLLNPSVWGAVTIKPRHSSLSSVLIHMGALLSGGPVCCCLLVWMGGRYSSALGGPTNSFLLLLILVLIGVILPALVAARLSSLVSLHAKQSLNGTLSFTLKEPETFSGLASEFWRRRRKERETTFQSPTKQSEETSGDRSQQSGYTISMPVAEGAKLPEAYQDSPEDGVVALDASGCVLYANRAFCDLVELRHGEPMGKSLGSLTLNPDIQAALLEIHEVTLGRGPRVIELKLNELPQKLRFLLLTSHVPKHPLESAMADLKSANIIITVKDITDRRTLEANLLEGQKLSSLGILVGGIGHCFNNMLTSIAGQASFARYTKDQVQVDKALGSILKSTQDAGNLVRQLLDYADAQRPASLKPENLVTSLEARLEMLQHLVGETCQLRFEKTVQAPMVFCDINLILQAITSLILNAKEACRSNAGAIHISLDTEHFDEEIRDMYAGAHPGDFARLRVRDNGVGMTSEILSRAFEPLYTTKSQGGHIGLGLASVFAIIRAHNGFLSAESHPDKGTTISIYLPLHASESMPASRPSAKPATDETINSPGDSACPHGNQEGILVVEDDENIRQVVSAMLSNIGYNVQCCSDGEEALEQFSGKRFDLLLVDMVMPKMHGFELIERIRNNNPGAKALLMTGYGAATLRPPEAVKIINKPFDIETLAKAVKLSLEQSGLTGEKL